jgi:translation initiation factor IF-3
MRLATGPRGTRGPGPVGVHRAARGGPAGERALRDRGAGDIRSRLGGHAGKSRPAGIPHGQPMLLVLVQPGATAPGARSGGSPPTRPARYHRAGGSGRPPGGGAGQPARSRGGLARRARPERAAVVIAPPSAVLAGLFRGRRPAAAGTPAGEAAGHQVPPESRRRQAQGGLISAEARINERIRAPEVRLVGPKGEQIGIVSLTDALKLAAEADLDLVEVAPTARPPVAKLMDYGKFKYESAVKARESRKNQTQTVVKEIKLRPKIDPHDYGTKRGHVERFLKAGDKVKVTIMFRGREQSRPELGRRLLERLAADVAELGFVESLPKQDGRNMIMVIGPHKKKSEAKAQGRPVPRPRPAAAVGAAADAGAAAGGAALPGPA